MKHFLGHFLGHLESANFGANTTVFAVVDRNFRQIKPLYMPKLMLSVPCFTYLCASYRKMPFIFAVCARIPEYVRLSFCVSTCAYARKNGLFYFTLLYHATKKNFMRLSTDEARTSNKTMNMCMSTVTHFLLTLSLFTN